MSIDDALNYFKEKEVSIQITLDIDKVPTVHALFTYNGKKNLLKTESITSLGALLEMVDKYEKYVSNKP